MADLTARQMVHSLLDTAHSDGVSVGEAQDCVQEALIYALLSVADEIHELRGAVNGVEDALEDQERFGVGTHARNISDWLEKIAKR
ncbi:hypothetical protein DLJ46_26940 [Micromonospora globispora]|uniref:Uncharacterized protein n=1 Tax=Micromonospora globispora TaxID=1450148 RepID=A0A317JZ43_9ACTN|nr:hypothetical protein [Micromonospora globispora]PWU44263.1 hypothetical protein DLJ46_26940 [Micromonospora globispora]